MRNAHASPRAMNLASSSNVNDGSGDPTPGLSAEEANIVAAASTMVFGGIEMSREYWVGFCFTLVDVRRTVYMLMRAMGFADRPANLIANAWYADMQRCSHFTIRCQQCGGLKCKRCGVSNQHWAPCRCRQSTRRSRRLHDRLAATGSHYHTAALHAAFPGLYGLDSE